MYYGAGHKCTCSFHFLRYGAGLNNKDYVCTVNGGLCRIDIFTVDCKIKTAVLGKNYLQRGAVGVPVKLWKLTDTRGDYFIALDITGKKHLENA